MFGRSAKRSPVSWQSEHGDWGCGLGRMGVFSIGVASGCTRPDATAMKPLLDASVRARAQPSMRDSIAQQ